MLAASLANLGRVGVIYHKSIEQLLVVLPALFAAITTAAGGAPQDEGAKLDFKLDLNDPPPCAIGFVPPPLMRTPGRRDGARAAEGHVLQDGAERPQHGAWRPQLPVPGVPRQTGADDSAVSRPEGLRAGRPQPVARSASAVRHPDDQRVERFAAQPFPVHPAGRRSRSGHSHRRAAPPGCDARARAGATPAGIRPAAAQQQRAAAGQPVVDAAGSSAVPP